MSFPNNYNEIVNLFRSDDLEQIRTFILGCPTFPMQQQAADFIEYDLPGARAMALGMVSQGLAFGRAVDTGSEVALAAHKLLREALEKYGPAVILPVTLSRVAYEAIHALNVAGRYEAAVSFADKVIPLYEDEPENIASIRVGKISALFELNRIDEVQELIRVERARGISGPAVIELDRIEKHIRVMTSSIFEIENYRPAERASAELADENFRQRENLDRLTGILSGSGEELNQWRVMKIIRDATSIFTNPMKERDPTLLKQSLDKLHTARDWARNNDSASNENDALWGIYLCHNRLNQPVEAAVALQSLRENIEEARAHITNPFERGGVSKTYPFLFESLCKMLSEANKPLELLDAIEGAKGRAIADLLAQRSGKCWHDGEFSQSTQLLPKLMRQNKTNYLSFLIDEEETYAVLVAKDGSVHSSGLIPLGRELIRTAARNVDPREWGISSQDPLWGTAVEPVDSALSPLLSWIEPLVKDGILEADDHICYSPDEHLHHVPLQYVQFSGQPLAASFSVSRTHGVNALVIALSRSVPTCPNKYVAVEVPNNKDVSDPVFLENLHRAGALLDELLDGESLTKESATPEALVELVLNNRIVHFASHGIFPKEGASRDQNPFKGSGLLLASNDGLPDEDQVAKGELKRAVITPKFILDSGLNFSDSHVTLQACVSGLAEEGLGGDALGLDWALIQAGASSLLASHWYVSARSSAEFFVRFYRKWLVNGLTRAQAWRNTILEMRNSGGELAEPYAWAAFSLCGEWR